MKLELKLGSTLDFTDMVLCSYKLYDYCKKRYPKRKVEASSYVACNDFYYFARIPNFRGDIIRQIRNKTEVWILASESPYIERRR